MRRPLSSPMAGILTRSQAEIYIHRSRSGRVRPDPAGWKQLHDGPIYSSIHSLDVKHLHERKRAVSVRCFPYMPEKNDHKEIAIKSSDGSKTYHMNSFDGLMSSIKDPENKDETFCEQVIRGESMQTTPPDVDILRRAEEVLDFDQLRKDCAEELIKASVERQPAADAGSDRLQPSTLKNKQIIAQCTCTKMVSSGKKCSGFEEIIPSSLSYVKDEKETDKVPMLINVVPSPTLKDDIIESEVKPGQYTFDLVSRNVNKMYDLNPTSYHDSMMVGESIGSLPCVDVESKEKHVTQSFIPIPEADICLRSKLNHNPNSFGYRRQQPYLRVFEKDISGGEEILDPHDLVVVEKTEELPIMLCVDPGLALQRTATISITDTTKENKKSDSGKSAPDPFGQNLFQTPMISDIEILQLCNSSSYSPSNSVTSSVKELVGNTSDSYSSGLVQKEPLTMAPNLRSFDSGSHALTPRKNILKKHTRRCIGLCTCLDCASYRLHAGKAFDFSRRQMLKANEIITTLMKELACLRKITEKSASPQVKEVYRNALKVDQAAKIRMRRLIREMRIRCKLPGQRLNFADHIEETRIFDCGKEGSGKD